MARRRQSRRSVERMRERERKNGLQLSKLLGSFKSCIGAEAFVASTSPDRETVLAESIKPK
jgi:hypothetical protein